MRNYQNWLQAYMAYTSDSESPDDFHFWTGVSTVAGALRRRVWIDMRKWQWTPNFYIILVGPPGVAAKSTSMRAGKFLLESVDGIHFGPPSTTWQSLTNALAQSVEHMKEIDSLTGEERYHPMSCLTIHVAELGTFLKPDDQSLMDVIVDLWDGQLTKWKHSTKTTGDTEILNPWLNVIGCTTPTWMRENIGEGAIGGGLMSRVIFVYGDRKRRLIPYPDEVMEDKEYLAMQQRLIEDLTQIASLSGNYVLTPEARRWGKEWYSKHWEERPHHMASDRYEGYIARKQTHMHKLAIVMAAVRSNEMVITEANLQEAELLLTSTEQHMFKAFESIGVVDEARHVASLIAFVRAHKVLTPDELWRLAGSLMEMKDFEQAIKAAVRGGALIVVKKNGANALAMPEGQA